MSDDVTFVGMNNFGHHSSVATVDSQGKATIHLRERWTQKKCDNSIHWPALLKISEERGRSTCILSESSYFNAPARILSTASQRSRIEETAKNLSLQNFFCFSNPEIHYHTHHYCHAMAASALAPFSKALVVVTDGAGSARSAFDSQHPEIQKFPHDMGAPGMPVVETCTAYLLEDYRLECVHKEWQQKQVISYNGSSLFLSQGLGNLYENAAKYIFGDFFDAGKVMGLAAFGKPEQFDDPASFVTGWDWTKAFLGKTKKEWEASPHQKLYRNLAASVQDYFQSQTLALIHQLLKKYPKTENLILSGGCALNCLTNSEMARVYPNIRIYVPPFPGDECIAFGSAFASLQHSKYRKNWKARSWKDQTSTFGAERWDAPSVSVGPQAHTEVVKSPQSLAAKAAQAMADGQILGLFRGASECGPRALGFRSILCHPGRSGHRDFLNAHVKGRESFRPFGCSCTWEKAALYFEIPEGFDSPFMSFAPPVRPKFLKSLSEVTHVDGTSRIQTVRPESDSFFHQLLKEFGLLTGIECLLNTSLNIMGKPLAETPAQALEIFDRYPIDSMIVFQGQTSHWIQKKRMTKGIPSL